MGDFCHRHIVGRKVIERSLAQMWGGQVGLMPAQMSTIGTQNDSILTPTKLNKGNGLTDTQAPHKTPSKEYYNFVSKSNTSQPNITKGAAAQTIVLETEQSTNETLGTLIVSTLTPVKSITEDLTIPELLGGVKSYDYLPPGWENVEVIATVAIGTQVQVYNLVSRQSQPGVVKDYWSQGAFWKCAVAGECRRCSVGSMWRCSWGWARLHQALLCSSKNHLLATQFLEFCIEWH